MAKLNEVAVEKAKDVCPDGNAASVGYSFAYITSGWETNGLCRSNMFLIAYVAVPATIKEAAVCRPLILRLSSWLIKPATTKLTGAATFTMIALWLINFHLLSAPVGGPLILLSRLRSAPWANKPVTKSRANKVNCIFLFTNVKSGA